MPESRSKIIAVTVVAFACTCLSADETAPATSLPTAATYAPFATAKSVAEGLRYTEMERTILEDVRDATPQHRLKDYQDKALFVLLRRAAGLPKPTMEELDAMDRPSYANLLKKPARYRGEAIRYTLRVNLVTRVTPGNGIRHSKWWPKDKPLWQVDCIDGTGQYPGDRPLRLFTTFDPTEILGGGKVIEDGISYGEYGRKVEVTAIFFRVFSARTRRSTEDDPEWKEYPILICWYMGKVGLAEKTGKVNLPLAGMVVMLIVMAGAYIYFKKKTRPHPGRKHNFRPPGGEAGDSEEVEIDPALKAAVEQYRQEHPDERDDSSG